MTTETTSAQVDLDAMPPMNPYTLTLLWTWIGALVVAGALVLAGVSIADKSYEVGAGVAQFVWAGYFGSLALGALLLWLLVNALRWQPPEN